MQPLDASIWSRTATPTAPQQARCKKSPDKRSSASPDCLMTRHTGSRLGLSRRRKVVQFQQKRSSRREWLEQAKIARLRVDRFAILRVLYSSLYCSSWIMRSMLVVPGSRVPTGTSRSADTPRVRWPQHDVIWSDTVPRGNITVYCLYCRQYCKYNTLARTLNKYSNIYLKKILYIQWVQSYNITTSKPLRTSFFTY